MIPLANVQITSPASDATRPESGSKRSRKSTSTSECPPAFNIDSERGVWDRSRTSSLSSEPGASTLLTSIAAATSAAAFVAALAVPTEEKTEASRPSSGKFRGILRGQGEKPAPLYRDSSSDTLGLATPHLTQRVTFSRTPSAVLLSRQATLSSLGSFSSPRPMRADRDQCKLVHNGTVLRVTTDIDVGRTDINGLTDEQLNRKNLLLARSDSTLGLAGQYEAKESSTKPNQAKNYFLRAKECFYKTIKKLTFGIIVMILEAFAWSAATQFLKSTYRTPESRAKGFKLGGSNTSWTTASSSVVVTTLSPTSFQTYNAPFFTTWFCSMGTVLFLPLYLVIMLLFGAKTAKLKSALKDSVHSFREKGLTGGKFFGHCVFFSFLWVLTNYLYVSSLRHLGCTEAVTLFATNISFIYLLSWVILHEQFVGIRIVAVILSNTGIALLAYMDGVSQTKTLGGVVMASASAAASATYKVLFKRAIGDVSLCQLAMFFSMIGICSAFLLWPLILALYFTGAEVIPWETFPCPSLLASLSLSLGANILANFAIGLTSETFITLGLILAVPACAVVDVMLHEAKFEGMKLSGIVLVACGFIMVLFPENWPDIIQLFIRIFKRSHNFDEESSLKTPTDSKTGKHLLYKM